MSTTLRETDSLEAARAAYTRRQARHRFWRRVLRGLGLLSGMVLALLGGVLVAEWNATLAGVGISANGLLLLIWLARVPEDR